jgi:hypothetical protein
MAIPSIFTGHAKNPVIYFFFSSRFSFGGWCQTARIIWNAHTDKLNTGEYKLVFDARIKTGWELYGPVRI